MGSRFKLRLIRLAPNVNYADCDHADEDDHRLCLWRCLGACCGDGTMTAICVLEAAGPDGTKKTTRHADHELHQTSLIYTRSPKPPKPQPHILYAVPYYHLWFVPWRRRRRPSTTTTYVRPCKALYISSSGTLSPNPSCSPRDLGQTIAAELAIDQ